VTAPVEPGQALPEPERVPPELGHALETSQASASQHLPPDC